MKKIIGLDTNKLPFIYYFIGLLALIIMHDAILNGLANISALFRKDNRDVLEVSAYKNKIENLEKELLVLQESLDNLSIYKGTSFVLAKIALRDVYNIFGSITIHTDKKVSKNSVVINEDGFVGIIKSSDGTSANVDLLTSGNKVSVKVASSFGLTGKYDEENNLILINNINNYENVSVGDEVVTSGFTDIERNIKIGKVSKVETKGIEKLVYVTPYVDFKNLNYLYVIEK